MPLPHPKTANAGCTYKFATVPNITDMAAKPRNNPGDDSPPPKEHEKRRLHLRHFMRWRIRGMRSSVG
jgi:hypothetical protein